MFNWTGYINITKNKLPRQLLVRALEYTRNREVALDLGAGALNESKYLLKSAFKKVIAVDNEEDSNLISEINHRAFSFEKTTIEDYSFLDDYYDLINAQFVLPFVEKEKMDVVISNIKNSLKKEGIFVGQFFGIKDSWSSRADVYVYTEEKVKDLLSGLDILYFQEEEKDGRTAMDEEKHWHIFHFIAKKLI
ncbi:hypothetical protein AUJ26_00870 [Candidatus Falkowbacteria bacterium CG1_02_37_21]|nr:MAG: hypothetical protein AUJ26_00870 [Candidatus Falkowbacteria bacterium CG1_02_37_21]